MQLINRLPEEGQALGCRLGSQPAPGKQDSCQVAVSLSVANEAASLPIDYRLYLPKDWAGDPARCCKAGVPDEIAFQTKPSMALDQIKKAVADGIPPGGVLADAGSMEQVRART